ncbi:MAG: ATP-binding protein, partial [Spirochaetaceae bacterium]
FTSSIASPGATDPSAGWSMSGAEEGFGLTLVQELVEQMGGRFYLESDGGTRARVVIPLEGQRRA